MSRSTSGSTSSDLAKGKKFIKKLLYVQHVDKEKETASEIPDRYLEEFINPYRTNFPDTGISQYNFPEYLKSPKSNLSLLKSSMGDWIRKVTVYSNSLPIRLQLKDVTIHAFVVFRTSDMNGDLYSLAEIWWSLEKNGHHIVLQQSPNKDDVIKKIYDTETKTSVERLGPIKKQKSDSAFKHVSDLMRIIVDTNKLNERYHLLYSNCQNFASFVFEKLSHGREKWSTVTSATFGRFGLKKKKIQPKNKVDAFKYKSIINDDKFDCYWAMMEGRRKDFKKLIKNLTIETLNNVDSQGYTLLEWATVFSTSHWPIDEDLKKKGATIPSDKEGLFRRNVFFIALQYLPSNKKLKLFDSFDGIDIHGVANKTGDTSLHLALYGEEWELAEEILNRFDAYDVNSTNSLGDTPLLLAARLNCEDKLFTKILERTNQENVSKVDENGWTALHYAIDRESEIKVKELLKREEVDVNIKNNNNWTPLHMACFKWKEIPVDLFKIILQKSTNVINAQDNHGNTALHYAISYKYEIKTKALLAHNDVDVNIKNNSNYTLLHLASKWPNIPSDLFKLILEKSTDVNAQTEYGWTHLHYAISYKSEIITKALLAHKDVDVKVKNNYKETALHWASQWPNIPADLFKIILEKSNDVNAQDEDG
jgi:ankyrin repeat protein